MNATVLNGLNQQAILLAISALQTDDLNIIAQLGLGGLADEAIKKLKALTAKEILVASDFRGQLAEIRINPRMMENFLSMASSKTHEDELIDEAIAAGMRQPVLQDLKGVTRREFTTRRTRLHLPENPRGRIENLDEDDEMRVLRSWQKHAHVRDVLERYVHVFRDTQVPLDQAYLSIVNQA
jgi:Protein of unknown function (DUF2857)